MIHSNSSTLAASVVITKSEEPSTQPIVSQPAVPDEWLTIAEVAVYLKVSRRTTWRWCKSGQLSAVKVGHQWRIARSDLKKFINRRGKLTL